MEVVTRAHELDPDAVILVITGYATIDTAVEAMKSGAYDFLHKSQLNAATLGRLSWVEVNPDTRRVVFSFEHGAYDADELCDHDELTRLRNYLDKQLSNMQGVVARLANRLQRRLMAQQSRSWEFDQEEGQLALTREGGHSHRRIVHVDDATGWAVQDALLKAALARLNTARLNEVWAAMYRPDRVSIVAVGDVEIEGVSELLARAVLSFLLTPDSVLGMRTEAEIRVFAEQYLAPTLQAIAAR